MKLKSTPCGTKAVDVNNPDQPALDLTTPMPGNTVFEGVEVWQAYRNYGENQGWYNTSAQPGNSHISREYFVSNMNTIKNRICYQPLEVKEQVREEAPNLPQIEFDDNLLNPDNYDEEGNYHTCKASNPELGAELKKAAEKYSLGKDILHHFDDNRPPHKVCDKASKGFIAGANWQATQQQGLVSLESVERILTEHNVDFVNYIIDDLKTLKQ